MVSEYGKTVALTPEGDLRLSTLNKLEWVSGERSVIQRLKLTLATIEGEDRFESEHGVDVFAIANGTEEEVKLELVEALSEDKDVQRVENIEIADDPQRSRRAEVDIEVTLVGGENVTFGAVV